MENDCICYELLPKAFSKLMSLLMEAIKQKSNHKNEHNDVFVWRRFDISRAALKGFIRITFVVMAS